MWLYLSERKRPSTHFTSLKRPGILETAGQRGQRWVGEWWHEAQEDTTEEAGPELGSKQLLLTVEASLNQLPSLTCVKHHDCSCLAGCFSPTLIPGQAGSCPQPCAIEGPTLYPPQGKRSRYQEDMSTWRSHHIFSKKQCSLKDSLKIMACKLKLWTKSLVFIQLMVFRSLSGWKNQKKNNMKIT